MLGVGFITEQNYRWLLGQLDYLANDCGHPDARLTYMCDWDNFGPPDMSRGDFADFLEYAIAHLTQFKNDFVEYSRRYCGDDSLPESDDQGVTVHSLTKEKQNG